LAKILAGWIIGAVLTYASGHMIFKTRTISEKDYLPQTARP